MAKEKVTIYEVKCSLCGQKIRGSTSAECKQRLSSHIDNDCKTASTMRDWKKQGIYKEMMSFIRGDQLTEKLKKLLKHYTVEEIKEALETIEITEAINEDL